MFRQLGLGALLAACAGAVLVPSTDVVDDGPIFRITVPIPPQSPHQPFPPFSPFRPISPSRHAVPKGPSPPQPHVPHNIAYSKSGVWKVFLLPIKDHHESLFLNVSTPDRTIRLNEYQLYPAVSPDAIDVYRVPTKLGLNFEPSKHQDSVLHVTQWTANTFDVQKRGGGQELLKIRVSIDSVNFQHVDVPDVILDAMTFPDGRIGVVSVQVAERDAKCGRFPLLCRWRAVAANMLARVRGKVRGNCHMHGKAIAGPGGRHSHHRQPQGHKVHKGHKHHKGSKHEPMNMDAHAPGQSLHSPPQGHHHHMTPHGQGRHHSRLACVLRKIGRVALHIVLPILVGLLAGVMAYVLGMFIGTAIVLMWARMRGSRVYMPVALGDADVEAEIVVFEKDGFVDEDAVEEPLPMYVEVED